MSAIDVWGSDAVVSGEPTLTYDRIKDRINVLPYVPTDPASPKPEGCVRVVCISDTHGYYPRVPDGDIIVHAGDLTNVGELEQIDGFCKWFASLPHPHKVFIAGNHDLSLHIEHYERNWSNFTSVKADSAAARACLKTPGITYLEDEAVEIMGLKFYGSPWQPEFCDWAYNLERGEPCAAKWRAIPGDTDVLVTHGPPLGHGDRCRPGNRAGCVDLLSEIERRIKPRLHVFGHIHEGYGVTTNGQTIFVNASTCTLKYLPTNPPLVVDLPSPAAKY